ncbi:hypothetical protein L1887_40447 [Cichorium endivia]|nr:hypothetical protein L1887_40447 [Cichorium endivia]
MKRDFLFSIDFQKIFKGFLGLLFLFFAFYHSSTNSKPSKALFFSRILKNSHMAGLSSANDNTSSTLKSPKFPEPTSEQEDEDVLIYDDQDDLADYIESPFNLDSHKTQVETLISANVKLVEDFSINMEKANGSMEENAKKVVKLESDILDFMKAYTESTESWNEQMQKVIHGFAETLKAEKEATAMLRSDLLKENFDLASALQSKIDKLRDDLASENELMDLVASKTTKIQLLKAKLQNTTTVLSSAVSQSRAVRVSEDVAVPKQVGDEDKEDKSDKDESDNNDGDDEPEKPNDKENEKENRDDTADVSKNDKGEGKKKATESPVQKPKFTTITNLKKPQTQECADDTQKPKADWFERMNVGDTSAGPSKRKTKKIGEDDVDEDLDMSEAAQLARAARENELDEILRITKQLDAEEAAKRQAEIELEARRTLFHDWDYETMKKEAIIQPIENWLQPNCSYDVGNYVDSQMDFPMTARVFLIRCFDELKANKEPRAVVNDKLFKFYLEHSKPQYMSWSLKKIVKLTPRMPHVTSPFRNTIFLARRGSDDEKDQFTMADLPFMNPFDWVSLFSILKRRGDHEILHKHVKKLLMGYILEVSNLDVEVASVLNTVLKCSAEKPPSDLKRRRLRKIKKGDWNVAFPMMYLY